MKLVFQFARIMGFCLAGELLHRVLPLPIPAAVYGLLLLFLALCVKLVKPEQVKQAGSFLTSLLPLLFVGPTVGITEQWGLIAPKLLPIGLLLLGSTVLTFGISGRLTQRFLKKERKMMTVLSCPKCGILKQGVPEDLDEFAEEILDEM